MQWVRLIALAALAGSSAPLMAREAGAAVAPSAREAAAVVDAFHAALHRGDARAAGALLSEDALIFENGGVERSKAEYAASHLPADAEFSKAVSSSVTRRSGSSAGSLAWISSEGRYSGTYNGHGLDQRTTETMVLRRGRAGWRIIHIHWSSAPAH